MGWSEWGERWADGKCRDGEVMRRRTEGWDQRGKQGRGVREMDGGRCGRMEMI